MALTALPGTGQFYVGADGMVKYRVTMQDSDTMQTQEQEIDTGKSADEAGINPGVTYDEQGRPQTGVAAPEGSQATGSSIFPQDAGYNAFNGGYSDPNQQQNFASPDWQPMSPTNYMSQAAGYNTSNSSRPGMMGYAGQPGSRNMADPNNPLAVPGAAMGTPGASGAVQPGAAAALGTPGASMLTQPGGRPGVDTAGARAQTLFNPDDPNGLMASVMRDMGLNPVGFGNPFIQFIKRAAPGIAMAFNIANAQQPGVTAQTQADNPYAARDFVKNALSSGSVLSTMGQAASQLPALASTIKDLGIGKDTDTTTVNPFLWSVANMMNQGFGEGTINMMAALLGPSMPSSLRAGYQTGLQSALGNAQYNYDWENANKPGAKTIWDYILGSAAQ